MAVYNASNNAKLLTGMHSFADAHIRKTLESIIYQRCVLPAIFASRNKGETKLFRPGATTILGGNNMPSDVDMARENAFEVHVRLQTGDSTVVKTLGQNDTNPSMGVGSQTNDRTSASFRWTGPIKAAVRVPKQILRTSIDKFKIADATTESTDQATEALTNVLNKQLWRGVPTDQSANTWDSLLGILPAMNTTGTYGNIARSAGTAYWNGNRVTTAVAASLRLIDQANGGTGVCSAIGKPLNSFGPGADLWIVSNAVFDALKQEALARGQGITVGDMPELAKVGVKYEVIKYGQATIIADPTLTGDWSAADSQLNVASVDSGVTDATKVMVGLTTSDWVFSVNPTENFRLTQFDDPESRGGSDDAITATINAMPRLYCKKPGRQILFTNVS